MVKRKQDPYLERWPDVVREYIPEGFRFENYEGVAKYSPSDWLCMIRIRKYISMFIQHEKEEYRVQAETLLYGLMGIVPKYEGGTKITINIDAVIPKTVRNLSCGTAVLLSEEVLKKNDSLIRLSEVYRNNKVIAEEFENDGYPCEIINVWGVSRKDVLSESDQGKLFEDVDRDFPDIVDFSRKIKTIIEVDLSATDEKLLVDFSDWLKSARHGAPEPRFAMPDEKRKSNKLHQKTIDSWVKNRVFQYIDLVHWAISKGFYKKITDDQWFTIVFPEDYREMTRGTSAFQKGTIKTAKWMMIEYDVERMLQMWTGDNTSMIPQ